MQLMKKEMKRVSSVTGSSRFFSRRDFLRASGGAALGGVLATQAIDLEAEPQAAPAPAGETHSFPIFTGRSGKGAVQSLARDYKTVIFA
jgi:hypothetical protein